jgi:hypothetical protein
MAPGSREMVAEPLVERPFPPFGPGPGPEPNGRSALVLVLVEEGAGGVGVGVGEVDDLGHLG